MLPIERRQRVIEIIQIDKRVLVSDLSKRFNVTEETIRRDLEKLEKEGLVTRTYGGAIINQHTNEDLPFVARSDQNLQTKQEIAQKALNYISDHDSLFVDSSSTCYELVKLLTEKQNITIITNSVKILNEINSDKLRIISTGGILRPHSFSLVGSIPQETVHKYNTDLAIISCKGIDKEKDITDSNEPDSELKKAMIYQAGKTMLLLDHTKFDNIAFVSFMSFKEIDYLVTDQKPTDEWIKYLHDQNVTVIY
ncbi:DeoR/GlpR family DNA-binding transcription regulator [Cytobacillus sp. Hz8]|uniref:DeoR/GlpR family DNA-binding transcription regulator n=1 Tax=Cytobacillus sp. Hz8 TaxID=3347168 RepID=UPI0035D91EFB